MSPNQKLRKKINHDSDYKEQLKYKLPSITESDLSHYKVRIDDSSWVRRHLLNNTYFITNDQPRRMLSPQKTPDLNESLFQKVKAFR
mmetsp:Transcript_26440/g.30571  ORF Transcript_26440/g.30571 Transcript_26440/m.30571 type:complete len:87 (+) Transcript_26440:93-353(+)